MRASVTKRLKRSRGRRSRLYLYLTPLLVAAVCGLFLSISNWRVSADIKDREAAQKALFAQIDASIIATKKQRVETALRAEAAARAGAAQTEASRQANASANPSGASSGSTCDVTIPEKVTVVVNKKHCISPAAWEPSDLAQVSGYYLRSEAAAHLQSMLSTATAAGAGFELSSAYRSYYDQQATYNYWIEINGSPAEADKVSARSGYSEHQTGLAIDLKAGSCTLECFASTSSYTWLMAHAAEYGFILRYPQGLASITGYEPEPWHWRYVGVPVAKDMKSKGIETLEMYFSISGGDYSS